MNLVTYLLFLIFRRLGETNRLLGPQQGQFTMREIAESADHDCPDKSPHQRHYWRHSVHRICECAGR